MASTYSTSLQLQLIANGEQSGVWGTTTNTNWNLIEQAVTGVQAITMSNANYTLSVLNGVSDEARNMVLVVGGSNSAVRQIIAPLVNKVYVVFNNTSGGYAITIGGSSGTLATVPNGASVLVYCDGVNFYSGITGSSGNFSVSGNLNIAGSTTSTGTLTATNNFAAGGANLQVYPTAAFTASISGTTLTVTAVASGTLFVGQYITGSGVTANTKITALGTGAGGTGTYTVNNSQSIGSISFTGTAGVLAPTIANTTDSSYNVATTAYVQAIAGGLGSMSTQNSSSVAITGGTIDNVTTSGSSTSAATGLGYLGLPQDTQSSGYTLVLADAGKHVYYTGGAATLTVPVNASVAFPVGTAITIVNNGSGSLTISSSATLNWAGTSNTGSRTLATKGLATILKVATDTWFISGVGVT